ncbi:14251_t:CDS:2, partial [Rhizophagus irregularis]
MGKIKKSTYFDKYGPSGSFMKAAKGTIKISTFMNNKPILDGFEDKSRRFKQLLNNRTHAIYEYLKRLGKNGKGKMKASKEAAQLIFIDCVPYRARSIQYWANFWLQHNHLP